MKPRIQRVLTQWKSGFIAFRPALAAFTWSKATKLLHIR